jgi:hypothetical protein
MNTKHRIVTVLLRLYPSSWRREYGAELADLLLARPLTTAIVGDVLWNGARHRLRVTEPATILGLAMTAVVTGAFVSNFSHPGPTTNVFSGVLQASNKTLPTMVVSQLDPGSEGYVLLLVLCGCWTNVKHGGRIGRSAMAAVKMTLIGGIPVMLADVLMLAGAPGFDADPRLAIAAVVAPLFALPLSAIWGAVGGQIGRRVAYFRRRHVRS